MRNDGSRCPILWSLSGNGPFPGVIDLYGTGGGLPEYRACLLSNYGFAVLALAFYGYEDLPKEMKEFNLEYFEEAVNYMLQHNQVGLDIDTASLQGIVITQLLSACRCGKAVVFRIAALFKSTVNNSFHILNSHYSGSLADNSCSSFCTGQVTQ